MRMEDFFIEIFAYVLTFLRRPSGDSAQCRSRVTALVESARAEARKAGIADADFQQALFPVVAWIDESVLCSQWLGADYWRKAPLQRSYFKTFRAGTEFYDRMEALPKQQQDIRAIYCLALALGFRGKYMRPADQALLDRLRQAQIEVLESNRGSALGQNRPIFTSSYPRELPNMPEEKVGSKRLQGIAGLLAGPALVVAALYVTYQLILGGMVHQILRAAG